MWRFGSLKRATLQANKWRIEHRYWHGFWHYRVSLAELMSWWRHPPLPFINFSPGVRGWGGFWAFGY
jgi:hypothetical protein